MTKRRGGGSGPLVRIVLGRLAVHTGGQKENKRLFVFASFELFAMVLEQQSLNSYKFCIILPVKQIERKGIFSASRTFLKPSGPQTPQK